MGCIHYRAPITYTSSGVVKAGPCFFGGFLLGGMNGVDDPIVTIYDNATAASGHEPAPTATYDASALGMNGVTHGKDQWLQNGCYLEITGTCEVTPLIGSTVDDL